MLTRLDRRIAAVAAVIVGLATLYWLPIGPWFMAAVDWVQTAGPAGVAAYAGLYLVVTLLMLPASWIQAGAGFLYGPVLGVLFAWTLSTGFGTINFLLGRTLLRDWVSRRLAHRPLHQALDRAVGEDGIYLVVLMRLSPLSPYNVMNYAFGLTRVRLRHYLLGSALGSLPPITAYAVLGSTLVDLQAMLQGDVSGQAVWMPWVVIILTLIATVLVTRYARTALRDALEADVAAAQASK